MSDSFETQVQDLLAAAAVGDIRLSEWEFDFLTDMADTLDIDPHGDAVTYDRAAKIREIYDDKLGGGR